MCQMELSDRLIIFAISGIGWRSRSFRRRCCSGAVHDRCWRLDLMPIFLTNRQQAHLGFLDSETRFVTSRLNSFPVAFIFARTRSRAVFDQRDSVGREFSMHIVPVQDPVVRWLGWPLPEILLLSKRGGPDAKTSSGAQNFVFLAGC